MKNLCRIDRYATLMACWDTPQRCTQIKNPQPVTVRLQHSIEQCGLSSPPSVSSSLIVHMSSQVSPPAQLINTVSSGATKQNNKFLFAFIILTLSWQHQPCVFLSANPAAQGFPLFCPKNNRKFHRKRVNFSVFCKN